MRAFWRAFNFCRAVRRLGLYQAARLSWCAAYSDEYYRIRVPGVPLPVVLRGKSTDAWVFSQVMVCEQYLLDLSFCPRRIVDAGANIGLTSLHYHRAYPDATIIAIEPDDDNFRMLSLNAAHTDTIHPVHAALWSEECRLRFADPSDEKCALRVCVDDQQGNIRGVTIRSVMQDNGWDMIDVLKLDVEGAEREIFSSSSCDWLDRINVVVVELHEDVAPGCAKALFEAARGMDYVLKWRGENLILRRRVTLNSSPSAGHESR